MVTPHGTPYITAHAYPTRGSQTRVDVRDHDAELIEAYDDAGRTIYSRRHRIGAAS